jgi:hypothetical protein
MPLEIVLIAKGFMKNPVEIQIKDEFIFFNENN